MRGVDWQASPHAGDLFGELQLTGDTPPPGKRVPSHLVPGLLACGAAAGAAAWLSDHYGFPIILMGLLIGLALNFISRDQDTHAGLDFASRTCLRLGIVVLGLQITFVQIEALGIQPFAALLVIMTLAFGAGLAGARISGQSRYAGILAGGATAICGASAALALYGVIGKERLSQAQFALTLVGVSLASAIAMSVYPALAGQMGFGDKQAGFLIGASIHDVAQAIGGGYAYSDIAGSYATIVKLARVALLAPIVMLVSLWLGPSSGQEDRPAWRRFSPPWFITAFIGVVALNSLIAVPEVAKTAALSGSKALLLLAVTATAMRSRMDLLIELGWRSLTPVIIATVVSFLSALAFVGLSIGG